MRRQVLTPMSPEELRADWKSFLKLLCAIAIPIALQNLLTTTASMVDTIMLANYSENAKGAVGICSKYSNLLYSGYWGFVGGGMLFMSQYWGARDEDGLCRAFGLTLSFMMAVGLVFASLALFAPMTVMKVLTDQEVFWEDGADYLRIISGAYLLQIVSMAISCLLRSTERVKIPLVASIASVLTNLGVNWVLIFGHLGFPKMGVRGAAIGTLAAGAVNLLVVILLSSAVHYPYLKRIRAHFRWNRRFIREYLSKSSMIIANEVLMGVGNFGIAFILNRQGADAVNALAVFNVFEGFVVSFFTGFTNAASVLVGKEVGAGHHEVAYRRAGRLGWMTPAVVLLACSLVLIFHEPLLSLFALTPGSLEFTYARGTLFVFALAATVRMTNWIHNDTYRSAGDPVFGTLLEICFMFALVLPLTALGAFVWKLPFLAVFALCYCDEPIRVVLMIHHRITGKWIRPVTEEGLSTLPAFRQKLGLKEKR